MVTRLRPCMNVEYTPPLPCPPLVPKAATNRQPSAGSSGPVMDPMFDQTVLGDASEAMGRVGTADGGGDPSGNGAGVAVPINFKELVVLTRRGGTHQCFRFLGMFYERSAEESTKKTKNLAYPQFVFFKEPNKKKGGGGVTKTK